MSAQKFFPEEASYLCARALDNLRKHAAAAMAAAAASEAARLGGRCAVKSISA
jgi:hypothetical protein